MRTAPRHASTPNPRDRSLARAVPFTRKGSRGPVIVALLLSVVSASAVATAAGQIPQSVENGSSEVSFESTLTTGNFRSPDTNLNGTPNTATSTGANATNATNAPANTGQGGDGGGGGASGGAGGNGGNGGSGFVIVTVVG
jgi:hypothetical protein